MKLSEKIRALRKEQHVTQAELAKALGLSMRAIQDYELKGSYPKRRETYNKMADFFDVDVNYLLTEDEDFVVSAAKQYGYRGAKQAEQLINEVIGLFAGGEMEEDDKDAMMRAIQDAYWESKEINKKYAPKKFRKNN